MIACLEGWSKRNEYFYRPEPDILSGYRRTLDASGGDFLFIFSHNQTAGEGRFSRKLIAFEFSGNT
jgi:hypothetical protein